MAGIAEQARPDEIDWLALAINRLGGTVRAAERIGVSKTTIYTWLESGLSSASFANIVRLSDESRISMEMLRQRLGPFPGAPKIPLGARSK